MWKTIKDHPVGAVIVSIAVGVAAVISVLAGLANIWNAMSHDTVPHFLATKGWAMTLPPWQAVLAACGGLVILVGQIAILREAYKQGKTVPVAQPLTVTVYEHLDARNLAVTSQVRDLFERAGWRMDFTRTEVPRHAKGIWLHGGTDVERNIAKWGLKTIGITPETDYRDDNPPTLQVIVGAYEAPKSDDEREREYTGAEVMEKMANERAISAYPAVLSERDSLRAELQEAKNERDGTQQAWLTCNRTFAVARLSWFAERVLANKVEISVTVRFTGYSDYPLAQQIEKLLQDHAKWPVTMDSKNDPIIRPDERFRVIFESPITGGFEELASIFQDGQLVIGTVGHRISRRDDFTRLVIEVLPTVKA